MKKIIPMILSVALVFLLTVPIFAQEKNKTADNKSGQNPETATGLPLTYQLSGKRGQTLEESTSITNYKKESMDVQAGVLDFEVVSEEGGIKFTNVVSNDNRLASWIKIDEPNFSLAKNESRTIDFKIEIPQDAVYGAHWAMMFFQGFNKKGDKQFENLGGAGALILVTVKGKKVASAGEVKDMSIIRDKEKNSIVSALRISNTGNDFTKPKGTITIYNTWGAKVDEIPLNTVIVFPGTISKILTEYKPDDLQMGRYKMVVNGFYGSKNDEFTASATIWILPWETKYFWYMLAGAAIIILIIIIFRIFKLEIRRKPKTKNVEVKDDDSNWLSRFRK